VSDYTRFPVFTQTAGMAHFQLTHICITNVYSDKNSFTLLTHIKIYRL